MHLLMDGYGPLHAQLTRALKVAVSNGRFDSGGRLPPSRALAQELGLSRNTVVSAYEQLRAEGWMDARVGSGTYISTPLLVRAANEPPLSTAKPRTEFAQRTRDNYDPDILARPRPDPDIRWNFQYGLPLVNPLLTTAWARELTRAAKYTPPNYPDAQGQPALRAAVCDYLARRRGVHATPDDVLIVGGTQQAVSLTARVLLEAGDLVMVEEPQYFALRHVLQIHGARVHGTELDYDGLRVDRLPDMSPHLICVTPSHQFPSGVVMSLSRRHQLLAYARHHQAWILECDYDGDFRYDAKHLAALRSLDTDGRVIYAGTFSKSMFPSLRLGYIVMPASIRHDLAGAKWAEDFGSSAIEQEALAHFMNEGGFERHLRRSIRTLQERRAALLDGLNACANGRIEIADSHAGMHLTVVLRGKSPAELDGILAYARQLGLGLHSTRLHHVHAVERAELLMGFCGLSTTEIHAAMPAFARLLDYVYS